MMNEREEEEASIARPPLPFLLFFPLLCSSCCSARNITTDANALLAFKNQTLAPNSSLFATWISSNISTICSQPWAYVNCSNSPQRVTELRLSGISLSGSIPRKTIGRLTALQTLSLRSNNLSGGLPSDFANLTALQQLDISVNNFSGSIPGFLNRLTKLKSLDLQNNLFNGTIPSLNISSLEIFNVSSNKLSGGWPSDFTKLSALQQLDISFNSLSGPLPSNFLPWPLLLQLDVSFNSFAGSIPTSLNSLTKLKSLNLQDNLFSGAIPPLNISSFETFNVSNNDLNGSIPDSLAAKFNSSSFTGNVDLCGFPLQACRSLHSPHPSAPSPSKLNKWIIVGIACGAAAAVSLLLLLLMLVCRKRKGGGRRADSPRWMSAPSTAMAGKEEEQLVFIEGKKLFDMDDLMRASAEMLGKGTLGRSYKVALEGGITVVTKRLHRVDDSRRDEYLQGINGIASLKHDNLLPLRAYCFGQGANLLVYDFMRTGSLSTLLHGEKQKPLDWEARVKIAATSARGLAFLHAQNMVHGNLKSSNVLLMSSMEACLADYHMRAFIKSPMAYFAPEITDPHTMITPQADVFSFGVLLLELLTAKVPLLPSASPIDLPRWVRSVAREEWSTQVLDPCLLQSAGTQPPMIELEEMLHLLQLAMTCVAPSPNQRPSMLLVVQTIDTIMCRTTHHDDIASHSNPQ